VATEETLAMKWQILWLELEQRCDSEKPVQKFIIILSTVKMHLLYGSGFN
jgi:hypothetical protein